MAVASSDTVWSASDTTPDAIEAALRPLLDLDGPALRKQRREKFLAMGSRGL